MWAGLGAVIIGAVIWAPPAWQEVTTNPGNLGVVANFLLHANGHHGFGRAISALAGGIVGPLSGLGGGHGTGHPGAAALGLFLLGVAGLAVVCWWRRQWLACALAGGIPLVASLCVLSIRRVDGPIFPYLLVWTGALTVCGSIALVLCVASPARAVLWLPRWGDPARLLGALVLAAGAIFAGWRLSDSAIRVKPGTGNVNVTRASDTVEQMLPRLDHRVLVCVVPAAWPTAAGVVADLRKVGRDARVSPQWLFLFGQELAPSGHEQVAVFLDGAPRQPGPLSADLQRRAVSGGVTIRMFQPRHGYVSWTLCPQGR
jgi:hypothetical protein